MKKIFILVWMFVSKSHAQTMEEFFQQKKTQKKYLMEQIAALQSYIGYVEKGYSIANTGLQTIHSIKSGDFHMHNTYFNSLSTVNPAIKKYVRVAEIIAMQISISNQVRGTIKKCKQLNSADLNYLQQVFNNVLDDCAKKLDELFGLITNSQVQMKDDERIKRIDRLYDEMQDTKMFTQSFSNSAKGLCVQKRNDGFDITIEKKLNGLQ